MRLERRIFASLVLTACLSACDSQGATVGAGPNGASPTGTPTPVASSTAVATSTPVATATPIATATPVAPTATATATASAIASTAAVGPLVFTPNQINFPLTSALGSSQTTTISQMNYNGPFTLASNPIICGGGLTNIPVTAAIVGNVLTVTLGALGVTGSCNVTVDGYPGTSGSVPVTLTVPVTTPPTPGPITFVPNPVSFDVLNAVTGSTAVTTITETGYTGAFTLPASPITCPFNLVGLTQINASILGNILTLTTGPLNASLLGTCTVTVMDSADRTGQLTVNFQLL